MCLTYAGYRNLSSGAGSLPTIVLSSHFWSRLVNRIRLSSSFFMIFLLS